MTENTNEKDHFYTALIGIDEIKNAMIRYYGTQEGTRVTGAAVNSVLDLFKILTIRTGRQTNKFEITNARISELADIKRVDAISKTIEALTDWGFLTVHTRRRGDNPTVYILNPDLIWCGRRTQTTRKQVKLADIDSGEYIQSWRQETITDALLKKARQEYKEAGGKPLGSGKSRYVRAYGKRFDGFTTLGAEL